MDLDIYEALVRRSLELGVPTGVVASIFNLSPDTCKELAKEVKVKRFNTDDRDEYLDFIQWETLERVQQMIRSGSPDQAARIASAVFGKQIAAAGRRPSSGLEESRAELLKVLAGVREGSSAPSAPGRFVRGNTAVDRRAHRIEDEDE